MKRLVVVSPPAPHCLKVQNTATAQRQRAPRSTDSAGGCMTCRRATIPRSTAAVVSFEVCFELPRRTTDQTWLIRVAQPPTAPSRRPFFNGNPFSPLQIIGLLKLLLPPAVAVLPETLPASPRVGCLMLIIITANLT